MKGLVAKLVPWLYIALGVAVTVKAWRLPGYSFLEFAMLLAGGGLVGVGTAKLWIERLIKRRR